MGLFSRFENKAEDVIEGGAGRGKGGIEPVKLAKRAYKEMQREKMVGVGHEYAPTLYNVLLSPEDDDKMSGYYPSLAGEIETYLTSKAESAGLVFDCPPLVRFIIDDGLKRGRFDVIAESVSPAIIAELRQEEMVHYGIKPMQPIRNVPVQPDPFAARPQYDDAAQGNFEPSPQPVAAEPEPVVQQPAPEPVAKQHAPAVQASVPYDTPSYEPAERPQIPYDAPDYESDEDPYRSAAPQPQARMFPPTEVHAPSPAQPASPASDAESAAQTILLGNPAPRAPQASLYDFAAKVNHPVSGARVIIGRGTACDIIVSDPSVSRHHAELLHDESGWLIRDTGSTNGMNVNGARASQSRIYAGDIITLGNAELEFQEG